MLVPPEFNFATSRCVADSDIVANAIHRDLLVSERRLALSAAKVLPIATKNLPFADALGDEPRLLRVPVLGLLCRP